MMKTADVPVAAAIRVGTISATPINFVFDIENSAVLVIDMQNDFGSEGGMFHRAGINISAIQRAVNPTRDVIQAAHSKGVQIVYLKMAFKADLSDAGPIDSLNFETDLGKVLKKLGIKHLFVTGCTTSICVEPAIRDAMFRDYQCILLEDCSAEPIGDCLTRSNHNAYLLTIQVLLGWTSSRGSSLLRSMPSAFDP
jgi:nicotinamidase-related amidase